MVRAFRWTLDGTSQRRLTAVQADAEAAGDLDWLVTAVASTVVRAHQHAAELRPGEDTTDTTNPSTTASASPRRPEHQGQPGSRIAVPADQPTGSAEPAGDAPQFTRSWTPSRCARDP